MSRKATSDPRARDPVHCSYPNSDSSDDLLTDSKLAGLRCRGGYDNELSSDDGNTPSGFVKVPVPAKAGKNPQPMVSAGKKGYWRYGPDGFKERRYVNPGGAPIIRKFTPVSEEKATEFSQKYNCYFKALTGKDLDFIITPTSQPYLSMLEPCRHRDRILMTMFEKRPVIWDLMGGSGSDTIAFMLDLDPESVVIVEQGMGSTEEKSRESKALDHNIQSFCRCFEDFRDALTPSAPGLDDARIRIKHMTAKKFIQQANHNPIDPKTDKRAPLRVNMAYLDPSWDKAYDPDEIPAEGYDPSQGEFEISPSQLFGYLDRHVWQPMKQNNIEVDVYVMKTRWEWSRVSAELEALNSDYIAVYSIQAIPFAFHLEKDVHSKYGEMKGQFHYMVLMHKKYRNIPDERSKWYMDLIRRGKKVYVDERTIVHPFKPRYADHLRFPTVYSSPHDHCFEVTPPDYDQNQPTGNRRVPPPSRAPRPNPPRPRSPSPVVVQPRHAAPSPSGSESEEESDDDEGGQPYGGFFRHLPRDQEASTIR
jgi:hypothetical protein